MEGKVLKALIVISGLAQIVAIGCVVYALSLGVSYISEHGLKSAVETIWEGPKQPTTEAKE